MRKHFSVYPQKWGLTKPDKNIDHRRVPNLMQYFERRHVSMTGNWTELKTYRPGDLVAWDLGGGVLHIGVVSDKLQDRAPLIVHNIGAGTVEENILLKYQVIGHYRLKSSSPAN